MFGFKKLKLTRPKTNSTPPILKTVSLENIGRHIIGHDTVVEGPFGSRRMLYADYVASGRAYGPIEDKIHEYILPLYANTHTESSVTGRQTTAFREQARSIIGKAINTNNEDAIIFCGTGCTGAIDKLIHILQLKLPSDLSRYGIDTKIKAKDRPVVFIGPFEHHSNDVQWRETIADVVTIGETKDGLIDLIDLERQLKKYRNRPMRIGSFSAASNVTGLLVDVPAIAKLLHKHGAMAAFDYAGGAPYLPIDMNCQGGAYLDAVFISPHKFVGGPGTPGLLVLKKKWANNKTPVIPGGGTVSYVSPCAQAYLEDIEHREEGGTPDIIGAIRAGLAFDLKEEVGAANIAKKEISFAKMALKRWGQHKNIKILGSHSAERLPIFSFLIRCGERYLHYNFVVALLNDMFGIQARGGCSCAGPYGHRLLDIDLKLSREYEKIIGTGVEILKPGWVRVGFNYFYSKDECEILLRAIEWVADHGYKLLPLYGFNSETGHWTHKDSKANSLQDLRNLVPVKTETPPQNIDAIFAKANTYIQSKHTPCNAEKCCVLQSTPEHLRWFSLAD